MKLPGGPPENPGPMAGSSGEPGGEQRMVVSGQKRHISEFNDAYLLCQCAVPDWLLEGPGGPGRPELPT